MAQLAALIQKRGTFKAQLTLFDKFLLDNSVITEEKLAFNIRARTDRIKVLIDSFEQVQSEIETLDNSNLAAHEAYRVEIENKYFDLTAHAQVLISNFDKELAEVHSIRTDSAQGSRVSQSEVNLPARPMMRAKLPDIVLPSFNGDFTSFREFLDTFRALVHLNDNLSNAQKLCYLKTSLKGEASSLLASLETTDDNYAIAFDMLLERYNNKKRIVYNHVRLLLELEPIVKESHGALRNLIDNIEKHIRCLKAMGQPVESWDALMIPIITGKLDSKTIREWETKINGENSDREIIPTYEELVRFLNQRQGALEAINPKRNNTADHARKRVVGHVASSKGGTCHICDSEDHAVYKCEGFLKLNRDERLHKIKELRLCFNCLRRGHGAAQCKGKTCKKCEKRHNTLIHEDRQDITANLCSAYSNSQVLLTTAIVRVKDVKGRFHKARALLDCGSQSCFMSENLLKKLQLPKRELNLPISGVGRTELAIKYQTTAELHSSTSSYKCKVELLIIPRITENLPLYTFEAKKVKIPKDIKLADPKFNEKNEIDILIGASVFWDLIKDNQLKLDKGGITLQETQLGWIVGGNIDGNQQRRTVSCVSLNALNEQLQRFWKTDEITEEKRMLTAEEQFCENHFERTYTRNDDGRFVVRIPTKIDSKELGDSYITAQRRLEMLERKLQKEKELRERYVKFLREYEDLGHMSKIELDDKPSAYLPHHGILKLSSETTKLRVVFDASCKTSSGLSVNDIQCVGPVIQRDLFSILNNFRLYAYVATADIEKMYQQILVHPQDRHLQRIAWREDSRDKVCTFELNTVTYGTAAASYLATKCLNKLAEINEEAFPEEANIIRTSFYVDDLIMGANTPGELSRKRDNITAILESAKMNLRKWRSNVPETNELHTTERKAFVEAPVKTLGVQWDPAEDTLSYEVNIRHITGTPTKRTILAATAQLFDPFGLLAPSIIIPKLIIQQLWRQQLKWDEPIQAAEELRWKEFYEGLAEIRKIRISRCVLVENVAMIEMHGFADASQQAYGACVYIKGLDHEGKSRTNLVAAKSKVAPIKTLTIPRLELCAARLLAKLMKKIRESFSSIKCVEYCWSDSTIVLCWIKGDTSRWATYVANRVEDIKGCTDPEGWRHVKTHDNPADIISRGMLPHALGKSTLWWHGPEWLMEHEYPNEDHEDFADIPERRITLTCRNEEGFDLLERFSSLTKLINVASYCYRFRMRRPEQSIGVDERRTTLIKLIKIEQMKHFIGEIDALKSGRSLPKKSSLKCLQIYLDKDEVLRVGGRIRRAEIPHEWKHPIILPAGSNLTDLIANDIHQRESHCGPQALLHAIREQYWALRGKNLARKIFRSCVKCFRANPKPMHALMGDLPYPRVNPAPPFFNTGLDYAGPFTLRENKLRKSRNFKGYIALFVCLATKAIHLELAVDLSTDSFLAALRRFVSRRGKPSLIMSDNATNFVGASNELAKSYQVSFERVQNVLAEENIQWKFIPARSPHFGGIWEAGVRSVKTRIKRVIGNVTLTIDKMTTLLTQIEACLNSRPLTPLTNDPNDLNALTPGHFLIGRPLTALPEAMAMELSPRKLHVHIQTMLKDFWRRWKSEYLHTLQTRYKWQDRGSSLPEGAMVVIIEENTPPLSWRIGRVVATYPGEDGVVRVALVRTSNGTFKRSVKRLALLPVK